MDQLRISRNWCKMRQKASFSRALYTLQLRNHAESARASSALPVPDETIHTAKTTSPQHSQSTVRRDVQTKLHSLNYTLRERY